MASSSGSANRRPGSNRAARPHIAGQPGRNVAAEKLEELPVLVDEQPLQRLALVSRKFFVRGTFAAARELSKQPLLDARTPPQPAPDAEDARQIDYRRKNLVEDESERRRQNFRFAHALTQAPWNEVRRDAKESGEVGEECFRLGGRFLVDIHPHILGPEQTEVGNELPVVEAALDKRRRGLDRL
jgi:hypothetical protein